jgi:cytochrome c oxidase subunit 3
MSTAPHQGGVVASSGLKQPYHLVDPSPWPIVGAAGAGLLLTGVVCAAHWGGRTNVIYDLPLVAGLLLVLFTMYKWWGQVLVESHTPNMHSRVVQLGLRYGMALFITSEVMFFVGFFWAFFNFAIFPDHVAGVANPTWPPPGIHTFDPFKIPFLNTMILLLSGVTVTWAHHALLVNDRKNLIRGLGITILLGMTFTSLQAFEYSNAPFHFAGGGIYPSVFFLATGFHGFHVIVGTTFLAVCWFRARAGGFTPQRHFGFEAAAWYWHFVDVVWLFLFCFIYVWGAGPPPVE